MGVQEYPKTDKKDLVAMAGKKSKRRTASFNKKDNNNKKALSSPESQKGSADLSQNEKNMMQTDPPMKGNPPSEKRSVNYIKSDKGP